MKKTKNDYTPEETEQFIFDRNAKRQAEREAKRNRPVLIVDSHRPFVGSIRDKFTGPRRNNFQAIS